MTQTYSITNLPPFKENTSGYMLPAPGAPVAVCVAPADAVIKRPAGWGEGQSLGIQAGTSHIAQDARGDSYPNQEFASFYELGEILDPEKDPRAAFLVGFWSGAAPEATIEVRSAQKTKRAIVLGEVTDEAIGATFVNHEGTTELGEGSRILQSPDDENIVWAVSRDIWRKKYANQGEILQEQA
jgi:hypothetical protein